jgi:hypothetical protein
VNLKYRLRGRFLLRACSAWQSSSMFMCRFAQSFKLRNYGNVRGKMFARIRQFFRRSPRLVSERLWQERFEAVQFAAELLEEFAVELSDFVAPTIPEHYASIRGCTIRFESLPEYCHEVPLASLRALAERLNDPVARMTRYLKQWDSSVKRTDALLRDYHVMPGDEQAVDNVRVLLYRGRLVQRLVATEIVRRGEQYP